MSETATATVVRYSVTTFENYSPQFSRVANQSIIMGLTWDDMVLRFARAVDGGDMVAAGTRMDVEGKPYFYRDHNDKFCKVVRYEK